MARKRLDKEEAGAFGLHIMKKEGATKCFFVFVCSGQSNQHTNFKKKTKKKNSYGSLELLGHLWDGCEEVSNEAKVSNLEDRGLGVLVDASNHLGVLHSGQVLNGTRDTHSNVQLRSNNFASLSNLH